jgi:hypothetical protein
VQVLIVVPLFLSAALFTYGLGQFFGDWEIVQEPLYRAPMLGIALYFGLWAGALAIRSIVRKVIKSTGNGGPKPWLILATAAVTGTITGYLFVPFAKVLIRTFGPEVVPFSNWHLMTFGTPVAIAMMLIAGVLHIGLMGRGMSDAHREWCLRLVFSVSDLGLLSGGDGRLLALGKTAPPRTPSHSYGGFGVDCVDRLRGCFR